MSVERYQCAVDDGLVHDQDGGDVHGEVFVDVGLLWLAIGSKEVAKPRGHFCWRLRLRFGGCLGAQGQGLFGWCLGERRHFGGVLVRFGSVGWLVGQVVDCDKASCQTCVVDCGE